MLIVGVGGIGAETARLAANFGITVIGVDARRDALPPGLSELHGPDALATLLPRADAVVLTVPETPATQGFFDTAKFTLMKPSGHTNFYGLTFGGEDLAGAEQKYTYFLVAQNGNYLIKTRAGEDVADVQASTAHAAVQQPDDDGRSTNMLEVRVVSDTISYMVNGTVVHTTPKSGATAVTDGIVGVRVNHILDVVVEDFEVVR